jgi:hypothetical protein
MYINANTVQIAELAENILRKAVSSESVVVFDIDATVLFNDATEERCQSRRNTPITRLYDVAIRLNIPVFFVTARANTEAGRAFTFEQLRCLGLHHFAGMYMRPSVTGTSVQNISLYKKECRKLIASLTGKSIALNIGDQWSDLFVCDVNTLRALNDAYGNTNLLFSSPAHSFSDWSLKLVDEE